MSAGGYLLSILLATCLLTPSAHAQEQKETLADHVEHWYVPAPANGASSLSQKFNQVFNLVFSPSSAPPFGRSIAFLAGVSQYKYLTPQLPSVHNDIVEMREFLLKKAGFDEVYVAVDDVVNRDLIEQYIKGILPQKMEKNDRLFFYYSGHGGDNQGSTGYMLFGGAQRGQFYGKDVLAVSSLKDWSSELRVQHVLLILDSCSSGLGIVEKSGSDDSSKLLLQTLSGNGSRTVLTAGTADEKTYAEDSRQKLGNSFFTKALLNAFESRSSQKSGFITITDLFADIEIEMGKFRVNQGKSTTPRMWKLDESNYRGTFVFLNPRAAGSQLTGDQAKALGVVSKGSEVSSDAGSGILEVSSAQPGQLSIDDVNKGYITRGETRQFLRQPAGRHLLQLKGQETETKEVTVEGGSIAYVSFGQKSPIDSSGTVPVGDLEVQSTHDLSGNVLIDNFNVGQLSKNGQLHISNLTAGMHVYRISGSGESEARQVEIKPNQTAYVVLRPAPPTGLSVTVR